MTYSKETVRVSLAGTCSSYNGLGFGSYGGVASIYCGAEGPYKKHFAKQFGRLFLGGCPSRS